MMTSLQRILTISTLLTSSICHAFINPINHSPSRLINSSPRSLLQAETLKDTSGNLHGESACFLPILQNDDEYIAPRIVQIAGAYPDVDVETYLAVSSVESADMGQWSYDFSDPNGPQMGTVALPGLSTIYNTEDPVVIIADHISLNVPLGHGITEPVDLVVLCDRSRKYFSERKFLILELEDKPGMVSIAAFNEKSEIPNNAKIHGQVTFVQIPWLSFMEKKKSGFEEEDQLY